MGGAGSGNRYNWRRRSAKRVVESCLSLDANRWSREGILKAGLHQAGSLTWTYRDGTKASIGYEVMMTDAHSPRVVLRYRVKASQGSQSESCEYAVELTATVPRFGGTRWWFICPLIVGGRPCGRRVAKLYLPPGGRYFGCRHCHDLTYTSSQESRKYAGLFRHIAASMGTDLNAVRWAMKQLGQRGSAAKGDE